MDTIRESSAWKRFWLCLDTFAVALDYDPIEELQTRVAYLERELAAGEYGSLQELGKLPARWVCGR